jgi:hypothetical protein
MKIGDTVKLCTDTYQLDAFISGEHEDGKSIGYWLVDCPDTIRILIQRLKPRW